MNVISLTRASHLVLLLLLFHSPVYLCAHSGIITAARLSYINSIHIYMVRCVWARIFVSIIMWRGDWRYKLCEQCAARSISKERSWKRAAQGERRHEMSDCETEREITLWDPIPKNTACWHADSSKQWYCIKFHPEMVARERVCVCTSAIRSCCTFHCRTFRRNYISGNKSNPQSTAISM